LFAVKPYIGMTALALALSGATGTLADAQSASSLLQPSAGPAGAQAAPGRGPHATAALVAETRSIVPGQPLQLALRQTIEPGWHTYWINPGDAGLIQ
jgi:DsbC/DsbD-like thiol-disulfide interchange protein